MCCERLVSESKGPVNTIPYWTAEPSNGLSGARGDEGKVPGSGEGDKESVVSSKRPWE